MAAGTDACWHYSAGAAMIVSQAPRTYSQHDQDEFRRDVTVTITGIEDDRPFITGQLNLVWEATPTFDASRGNVFVMTLTGNVTSSTLANARDGQPLAFILRQDATGSRTFAWPSTIAGGMVISGGANTVSAQEFRFDRSVGKAYAISPGVVGM